MTVAEERYMGRVARLGCIVCFNRGILNVPATMHHIRDGQGMGDRASDFDTLPLRPEHHQRGGYGVALHAGREEWERRYGTERQLLAQTRQMLGVSEEWIAEMKARAAGGSALSSTKIVPRALGAVASTKKEW